MNKFCGDKGYDYDKFTHFSRRSQKEFTVPKEVHEG